MRRLLSAGAIALAASCITPAFGQAPHWTCVDAKGQTVATDAPCPSGSTLVPAGAKLKASLATVQQKPDWRSNGIPVWIWPIVAVLGLAWVKVLLPENLFRSAPAETSAPKIAPVAVAPPPPKPAPPAARPAVVAAPPAPPPKPAAPVEAAPRGWSVELIEGLPLQKLELLVLLFWQARGCQVQRGTSPDGNTELAILRPTTGKLFALARCTPLNGEAPGIDLVRGFSALGLHRQAGLVIFYALPGFTEEAQAFALGKPIKLVTAGVFLGEIGALAPEQQQSLLDRLVTRREPPTSGPALVRA